jgi:hypothetical protein
MGVVNTHNKPLHAKNRINESHRTNKETVHARKYQQETLKPHKTLGSKGLTIKMAIHDLTRAYRISDKILMLNNG